MYSILFLMTVICLFIQIQINSCYSFVMNDPRYVVTPVTLWSWFGWRLGLATPPLSPSSRPFLAMSAPTFNDSTGTMNEWISDFTLCLNFDWNVQLSLCIIVLIHNLPNIFVCIVFSQNSESSHLQERSRPLVGIGVPGADRAGRCGGQHRHQVRKFRSLSAKQTFLYNRLMILGRWKTCSSN